MTIDAWMAVLQTDVAAVSGLNAAYIYSDTPGTLKIWPAAIIMPVGWPKEDYSLGGPQRSYWNVDVFVATTSQLLPQQQGAAVALMEPVRDALAADITLGGTVETCLPREPFGEGPTGYTYGSQEVIGFKLFYVVKVNNDSTLTVSA